MSFLHVGIADIYQTIHTLNNSKTAKAVSEFSFVTAFVILASTIDGRVPTLMSANYVIKVMSLYCDTIAIGDISYRYELI
jgi:hypothetical protein